MDLHSIRQQLKTKSVYDISLRVTYYARVSSESDEQLNSLGNQIGYYEDFIRKNSAWEFVSGYIDEGLSGISTKRRENFNRMIDDAEEGKFDLSSLPPLWAKPAPRGAWGQRQRSCRCGGLRPPGLRPARGQKSEIRKQMKVGAG